MTKARTGAVSARVGGSGSDVATQQRRRRGRPRSRPAPLSPVDGHRFSYAAQPFDLEEEDDTAAETGPELLDMGFDEASDGTVDRFHHNQSDNLRGYLRSRMRTTLD